MITPPSHLFFFLFIFLSNLFHSNSNLWRTQFNSSPSLVFSQTSTHCLLTNSYLKTSCKTFYVGLDNLKFLDECSAIRDKWSFQLKSRVNKSNDFSCDQVFQRGYVFSVDSTNACIRVEILVSLYAVLKSSIESSKTSKTVVLMPSMQKDWATDLFMDDGKWWIQLLKIIAEPSNVLPLDSRLAAMQKTMCFKELVSEVPKVNFTRDLVHGFVSMVKRHLHINQTSTQESNHLIISSSISNSLIQEAQIITTVEIIDTQEMSFENQLNFIQKATIFIGKDQTDLALSLFLPPNCVLVRIISETSPSQPVSLLDLLRKRGPYIEWHPQENKLHEFGEVIKKIQRHLR